MDANRLVLFINRKTGDEYVVIVTEGEPSEHAKPGFEVAAVVYLEDGDTYRFPTDRALVEG